MSLLSLPGRLEHLLSNFYLQLGRHQLWIVISVHRYNKYTGKINSLFTQQPCLDQPHFTMSLWALIIEHYMILYQDAASLWMLASNSFHQHPLESFHFNSKKHEFLNFWLNIKEMNLWEWYLNHKRMVSSLTQSTCAWRDTDQWVPKCLFHLQFLQFIVMHFFFF